MGDTHEDFLVALFGGRQTRGSGNQWHNPMDGRQSSRQVTYAFAWDGKSTLGKSVGVSLEMWGKAREQAHGERPMVALRWYANERLEVKQDLVVIDAHDFAEILEAANTLAAAKESGCLVGTHYFSEGECTICGADPYNMPGAED
jgi:hypothetical protein